MISYKLVYDNGILDIVNNINIECIKLFG